MRVIYSFNKRGFEAEYWTREIEGASTAEITLIPFNHGRYVDPSRIGRAQLLDNIYFEKDAHLERLYSNLKELLRSTGAHILLVDNCPPYHPEFLRELDVYKVLRTGDGPLAAYDRDFAYVHAYDHVLYHSPAYSRDLGMAEKLRYVGAKRIDLWPNALFDAMFDPAKTVDQLFEQARDLEIVFVGALFPNKMALLARIKREFGRRFHLYGIAGIKKNLYFNVKYRCGTWVRPIAFSEYVPLYQRARLGVNVHNRGKYTVGSYRLFDLPGNGVMQLSDGAEYLSTFFATPREIVPYDDGVELLTKLDHYLSHEREQKEVARAGYERVMRDHRIGTRLRELTRLLAPATN